MRIFISLREIQDNKRRLLDTPEFSVLIYFSAKNDRITGTACDLQSGELIPVLTAPAEIEDLLRSLVL